MISNNNTLTIPMIKQYVKQYPDTAVADAWSDMLQDDPDNTEYDIKDYEEEATYAIYEGDYKSRIALGKAFPVLYSDESSTPMGW
jgi:hypothetical protein